MKHHVEGIMMASVVLPSAPRLALACVISALTVLASLPAVAEPSATEKAAAETLFDEGRKLMQRGDFAQACKSFAESQKLDAGVGTLIYLADCYEKDGRLASSWATFREAAAAARSAGQLEREKLARERAEALEPRLPRLIVVVPADHDIEGLEVRHGDTTIARPLWGTPLPVDGGTQTITVTAPGRRRWTTRLVVDGSSPLRLEVPLLVQAEPASAIGPENGGRARPPRVVPRARDSSPSGVGNTQRLVGYTLGGVGLVALGLGTYFWQDARSKHDDARDRCTPNCDATARSLQADARSSIQAANIALIGGSIPLAAGVVLVLTAPAARTEVRASLRTVPAGRRSASLFGLEGAW